MRCCLPLAACLLASAAAADERVLVVGNGDALLHETVAAAAPAALAKRFSPAGLALLAMDALGLPTGSLSSAQLLVKSPVQADVFSRADAYAMVFVDHRDAAVLAAVDATQKLGYHKIFDLTSDAAADPSTTIPKAIANELKTDVGARARCAGSKAVCSGDKLTAVKADAATLELVYNQHKFLNRNEQADIDLAKQLADTQQLTAELLAQPSTPNTLLAVGFASVDKLCENKRRDARDAIATQVQALMEALQKKYPTSSGALVVASADAQEIRAAKTKTEVNNVVAYSRMLLNFNEKIGGSSLDVDDDDDDDDDLVAVNGTKSDVTIEDIAEYQIVLWTSVLLGAVLLLVLIAMCNMNNKRDSLLYAKFTTSNAGRKFD